MVVAVVAIFIVVLIVVVAVVIVKVKVTAAVVIVVVVVVVAVKMPVVVVTVIVVIVVAAAESQDRNEKKRIHSLTGASLVQLTNIFEVLPRVIYNRVEPYLVRQHSSLFLIGYILHFSLCIVHYSHLFYNLSSNI